MSNIRKYQVPELVVLKQNFPKALQSTPEEQENLFKYLNIMIGIKQEHTKDEILVFLKFVESYTIPELKKAYELALKGFFPGIKVFRELNANQAGEIMKAYQNYYINNSEVKKHKRFLLQQANQEKTISEAEKLEIIKNGCQQTYLDYLKNDFKATKLHHLFLFLYSHQSIIFKTNTGLNLDAKVLQRVDLKNLEIKKQSKFEARIPSINEKMLKRSFAVELIFDRAKDQGIKNIVTEQIKYKEI